MAETPVGYFPDVFQGWDQRPSADHLTEITVARNGREQRRGVLTSTGLRRFTASSDALDQNARKAVLDFYNAKRGRLTPFYFFAPTLAQRNDVACGTAAAQSRIIVPYRTTNPAGAVAGSLTDVRVAGVSLPFTLSHLIPRPTTYAALRQNGTSSYVDCGTSAVLHVTGTMTLAAWLYLPAALTAPGMIMGNEAFNASGVSLYILGDRTLFYRTNQAGASTDYHLATTAIPIAQWTHVAVSRSGANVTFYVNGSQVGVGGGISDAVAATASFKIGGSATGYFDGIVGDAQLYGNALSAGEVALVYSGAGLATAFRVGWWKLTEGTGTTVVDSSGYGNTGTLTNSPTWVGGEDEVVFSAPQTGAVTVWGTARERIVCRFDTDSMGQTFIPNAGDVRAIFSLALKEVF